MASCIHQRPTSASHRKIDRCQRRGSMLSSPSLRPQYVIGLLGICLVFAPMLEALGTHINLGLPLRIGGILAVALAVAAAVQIEERVMRRRCEVGAACAAGRDRR